MGKGCETKGTRKTNKRGKQMGIRRVLLVVHAARVGRVRPGPGSSLGSNLALEPL